MEHETIIPDGGAAPPRQAFTTARTLSVDDPQFLAQIAAHEAGHILLAVMLRVAKSTGYAVVNPHALGSSDLGYMEGLEDTFCRPLCVKVRGKDDYKLAPFRPTRAWVEKRLMVLMGGIVGEQVCTGTITLGGASGDVEYVRAGLLRSMPDPYRPSRRFEDHGRIFMSHFLGDYDLSERERAILRDAAGAALLHLFGYDDLVRAVAGVLSSARRVTVRGVKRMRREFQERRGF